MKSLLELYGQQFRNPMLDSDSQDYTTADVFGQMGANKRRSEYDNSLLGMVHNGPRAKLASRCSSRTTRLSWTR